MANPPGQLGVHDVGHYLDGDVRQCRDRQQMLKLPGHDQRACGAAAQRGFTG
jgi:hypothetical protein